MGICLFCHSCVLGYLYALSTSSRLSFCIQLSEYCAYPFSFSAFRICICNAFSYFGANFHSFQHSTTQTLPVAVLHYPIFSIRYALQLPFSRIWSHFYQFFISIYHLYLLLCEILYKICNFPFCKDGHLLSYFIKFRNMVYACNYCKVW